MMHPGDLIAMALVLGSGVAVFRPLAKAVAARISSGNPRGGDTELVRSLEARLSHTTDRLGATEADLARMAEKVEFLEKVLAKPPAPAQLTGAGLPD
ncbi:MAG TPA: hypothetical protein VFE05_09420 [Longimicrobiaceae bacterium]|jgi:hypothetical protein|nr:hypothetical protein [Longimicrobiaceae bacterium]